MGRHPMVHVVRPFKPVSDVFDVLGRGIVRNRRARREIVGVRTPRDHLILATIGLLWMARLVLLAFPVLMPEEAYYWMYSKYPSGGYLDHPPMVAWLIGLGTLVFGDTEFGVRFCTWVFGMGSTCLCYVLGTEWGRRRTGLLAAGLFTIAPVLEGVSFLAFPDGPLVFFWLLTLIAVTRAYRNERLSWWILAGITTGLGFLSKYPAAFLALGTFLFLVTDQRGRRMLRQPGPWIALLVAVIFAAPVLLWNREHDWASFRFQFARRLDEHTEVRHAAEHFRWVFVQFWVLSPLVFGLLAASSYAVVVRFRANRTGLFRFAACFGLPWLAICFWHGLYADVKMNWPLPAFLGLLPVAARVGSARGLVGWVRLPRQHRLSLERRYFQIMIVVIVFLLAYVSFDVPLLPKPTRFFPWDHLGQAAEAAEEDLHRETGVDPFIIGEGNYEVASALGFYMRDQVDRDWNDVVPTSLVTGGGLSYAYWRRSRDFSGRPAICVMRHPESAVVTWLRQHFDRVDAPQLLYASPDGLGRQRRYFLLRCYQFTGFTRTSSKRT